MGKIWFITESVILPISIATMLFALGKDKNAIGNIGSVATFLQLIPLIGSIFPVEKALKNNFNEDGNMK